jgi:hypothetical protein
MNIYRLYIENGNRAGFWVQHRTWTNTCAHVQTVAGRQIGSLPGVAPLHDGAEVRIWMFDVRSGRLIQSESTLSQPEDRNFNRIAEPQWYDRESSAVALQDLARVRRS